MKHFKKLSCLCMVLGQLLFLTGCPHSANGTEPQNPNQALSMTYWTYFDTVSKVISYAGDTPEQFQENCEEASAILNEYHQLFDIYHEYTNVTNLCSINRNAGGEWMQVDDKLIDFLLYAKELYTQTNGEMNVMLGSVLRIWHDKREQASQSPSSATLPTAEELSQANEHTAFTSLQIDEENNRVRIDDKDASIDVGALGKGYATEMTAQHLIQKGITSYVLNIGGNIRAIGTKQDGEGWLTGITNPLDKDTYASYMTISNTSCVTSGNYERYYTVENKRYHHIIDKDTLMPSEHFASVTVLTPHGGLADALSTALFCMSYADGIALLEKFESVEVCWIDNAGNQTYTDGFSALLTERN